MASKRELTGMPPASELSCWLVILVIPGLDFQPAQSHNGALVKDGKVVGLLGIRVPRIYVRQR